MGGRTGTGGSPLDVRSNYFQLVNKPDMHLLQYRVDFTPEVDHPGVKRALIRVHLQTLGKYIFDGTLLYNTIRLPQPLELLSRRTSDGSDVRITLNFTNEIQAGDPVYVSVSSILHKIREFLLKNNFRSFSVYEFDFTQLFGQTQHGHDATKLLRCRSQGRCSGIHPKSMSNKCQLN